MASDRASILIDLLHLEPHPEGGHFAEIFRSAAAVDPRDGRPPRPAITTIFFLLRRGEHSALHAVASDEVWHFYEGDPLELVWADSAFSAAHRVALGPVTGANRPVAVVPAGGWQAARTSGRYTLVGCSVGPGFDYADFRMLAGSPDERVLRDRLPGLAEFL
jgi:predicted cupin superfamily sugar epimerase